MGRKKKYTREMLIEKAMDIFRIHGYGGTSAEMLVEGLGVNRYSIYAEFGSKQGLFEAALDRYDEVVVGRSFGRLESESAGYQEILELLEFYRTTGYEIGVGRGCLLCNSAVEFGANDPTGGEFVQMYFKRLARSFRSALKQAVDSKDLPQSVDIEKEADFLSALLLGVFVMLRANAPKSTIQQAAQSGIDHLVSLKA